MGTGGKVGVGRTRPHRNQEPRPVFQPRPAKTARPCQPHLEQTPPRLKAAPSSALPGAADGKEGRGKGFLKLETEGEGVINLNRA